MSARQLLEEARSLSVQERMELAADIWDSISEASELPVSEVQRSELRRRMQYYDNHPEERGLTLGDIKAKLGLPT
jgi:putative addiction module component (TIGR02574 family)